MTQWGFGQTKMWKAEQPPQTKYKWGSGDPSIPKGVPGSAPSPQQRPQLDVYTAGRVNTGYRANPYGGSGGSAGPILDGFGVSSSRTLGAPFANTGYGARGTDAPPGSAQWNPFTGKMEGGPGSANYADTLQGPQAARAASFMGLGQPGSTFGQNPSALSGMFGAPPGGAGAPGGPGGLQSLLGGAGGLQGFGGAGGAPGAPGLGGGAIGGNIETALADLFRNPAGADLAGERDVIAGEVARARREAMRGGREQLSRQGMIEGGNAPGIMAGIERDAGLAESRLLADLLRDQAGRRQQGLQGAVGLGAGYLGQQQNAALNWLRTLLAGNNPANSTMMVI